jgi:CheY-like chemotaxis protein
MICLYLPRYAGAADTEEEISGEEVMAKAQQGETILVVDDEPTIRMLASEVLTDLGYFVIEAGDGAEAMKIVTSPARIDLLITDVGLPGGMNGRQVAEAVRVERPGLKVLFITGYAENAVLSHGHLDVGMHVLTKPFALQSLADRVKTLIDGG